MMYFWVRITKDLHYRRLSLFYGSEGDYDYFYSRQGYPPVGWSSKRPTRLRLFIMLRVVGESNFSNLSR